MRIINDDGGGTALVMASSSNSCSDPIFQTNLTTPKKLPETRGAGPSSEDLQQLWKWNLEMPKPICRCMHDYIQVEATKRPSKIAVQSWDGSLTYRELDHYSSWLARQLRRRGLTVGEMVPLCFEKSLWTVVALLAVSKAGGTFSLMDPSQPKARLQTIVQQTRATLIITSQAQKKLGELLVQGGKVLAISRAHFDEGNQEQALEKDVLPAVPASTPMYVVFTSGSTGRPKGVVISHENYTSGAIPRAKAVGYGPESRVFDFPSYAFDVSIDCMLCTLAHGGQICIPSEADRINDLSGAIRRAKANMVHMTPSVARLLEADVIPSLHVLGLGGESVSASDATFWSKQTVVVIAYGPSECTVGCTINETVASSTGIGRGVGGVTWIVDSNDDNLLVPIGEVGELLIEGPIVGLGYLDEPALTDQVFIQDPVWLTAGCADLPGRRGRMYKTGDLVRYEDNRSGSIEFVGRKDQQVKIRGQRVELSEVEHHLRSFLPPSVKVAAEVIEARNGSPTLVAFLSESTTVAAVDSEVIKILPDPSPELGSALIGIEGAMAAKVPQYMVPATLIVLEKMPYLVSGKVNRKRLRDMGPSIGRTNEASQPPPLHGEDGAAEEPATGKELILEQAWRETLGQEVKVQKKSNFFALGGDSLRAMRLVAAARAKGMALTVATIFARPTLSAMAEEACTDDAEATLTEMLPYALLAAGQDVGMARREAAALCGIEADLVEDLYPCTPLQEAPMALSAKVEQAYVAQRVVELPDMVAAEKLAAAFGVVQKECPILRTRIVQMSGRGLFQVVVKEEAVGWQTAYDLDEYLATDRACGMGLGKPLMRYTVVGQCAGGGKASFVLTLHHALYDGWCMPLMVDRANRVYRGETLPRRVSYKHFIRHLCQQDRQGSEKYWREQLRGTRCRQFPSLPYQGYQTRAESLLEMRVPLDVSLLQQQAITVATVIRAAWALVVSRYINSEDVVFGETLTGRNAPIAGVEEMEGPTITTVPVRIRPGRDMLASEYLQLVQGQMVAQMDHEHLGLQHIRKLGPDALEACELRTGLVIHPGTGDGDGGQDSCDKFESPASQLVPVNDAEAAREALRFNTYALMLVCSTDPKGFQVMASFDSRVISSKMMQAVLRAFKTATKLLGTMATRTQRLGEFSLLEEDDLRELRSLVTATRADPLIKKFDGAVAGCIVDPEKPSQLVPVGAVGELLLVVQTATTPAKPSLPLVSASEGLLKVIDCKPEPTICLCRSGELVQYGVADSQICLAKVAAEVERAGQDGGGDDGDDSSHRPQKAPQDRTQIMSTSEEKLRRLWGRVLDGVDVERIGPLDSFFVLGGDSISAMKLVSEARREGLVLTVAQLFRERTLVRIAGVMVNKEEEEEEEKKKREEELAAVATTASTTMAKSAASPAGTWALLDAQDIDGLVKSAVRPLLADQGWTISQVLPARPLQLIAARGTAHKPRYSVRYELILFEGSVSKAKLMAACRQLVSRNEILRTVFVEHAGRGYAVVVDDLQPELVEFVVDDDVDLFCRQLCQLDIMTSMPLGSSFAKWFLVQSSPCGGQADGLVLRLSHAQYDEICLPLLLQQLAALYEGKPVAETVPFSSYVGHVLARQMQASIAYWRRLLAGARMTVLRPEPPVPVLQRRHAAVEATVDLSRRPRQVTVASLPTAAWALCLARRLAVDDVVFGEVVSGRNVGLAGGEGVIGPCWQYVPVRVRFDPAWTGLDLLLYVEQQHAQSSAYEGIGLSEIMANCTDWGHDQSSDWFDSVVHQDVAHVTSLSFAGVGASIETVYPHEEPLREWKIQAFIDQERDRITLEIVTVESWAEYANGLLLELVDAATLLINRPEDGLFPSAL